MPKDFCDFKPNWNYKLKQWDCAILSQNTATLSSTFCAFCKCELTFRPSDSRCASTPCKSSVTSVARQPHRSRNSPLSLLACWTCMSSCTGWPSVPSRSTVSSLADQSLLTSKSRLARDSSRASCTSCSLRPFTRNTRNDKLLLMLTIHLMRECTYHSMVVRQTDPATFRMLVRSSSTRTVFSTTRQSISVHMHLIFD